MLQAIRDKTQNWISILIIGFLILMFGMWGISYYLGGSSVNTQELVKVNNQSIPVSSFQSLYNLERQVASDQINSGQLSLSDLKSLILNELIENNLRYQAAVSAGLGMDTQDIDAYISAMPIFQTNQKFSQTLYQNYLQQQGLSTNQLREKIKNTMLINQWDLGFAQSDFVLPKELSQYVNWMNQTREIQFISIPATPVIHLNQLDQLDQGDQGHQEITDQEALNYYNQNKTAMMAPAQVKFNYILLSLSDFKKKPNAEEQYADLGNQLANLSFENPQSLDPAASQLGLVIQNSGWISQESQNSFLTNPKILSAAFSPELIKSGQNSDPINLSDPKDPSNQRVIVLQVTDHREAKLKPFDQVKDQCKKAVLQERQTQAAFSLAQSIQAGKYTGPSLPSQTETISRTSTNFPASIISAAFNLSSINTSQIVKLSKNQNSGGYAIVKLLKIIPPKTSDIQTITPLAKNLRDTWVSADQTEYLNYLKYSAKIVMSSNANL